MRRLLSQTARSSERGFAIVAVLWILVALSALATIFSIYLSKSARVLGANDIGIQAEALASAGLELAAYQLLSAEEKARPAQGSFRFRMNNADVAVTFTSEAARIDLNKAPKDMLANLFEVLGAEQKAAAAIADRIDGWRTQSRTHATGTGAANSNTDADDEAALYLAAGLAYAPRRAPFAHVNELGLVLGISPALVERALPFVTVYSKSADIDALLAAPEVVAALPGMTPELLNDFLKQRPSLPRDQKAVAAALAPVKAATLPDARAFRVVMTMRFDNGRRTSTEAVISLSNAKERDKQPYSILSWQDQAEIGDRPVRRAGR